MPTAHGCWQSEPSTGCRCAEVEAVGATRCRWETTMSLLISTGHLAPKSLADKVVIVTGSGRGIGVET
jgi:hypothetical protein